MPVYIYSTLLYSARSLLSPPYNRTPNHPRLLGLGLRLRDTTGRALVADPPTCVRSAGRSSSTGLSRLSADGGNTRQFIAQRSTTTSCPADDYSLGCCQTRNCSLWQVASLVSMGARGLPAFFSRRATTALARFTPQSISEARSSLPC